MNGRPQPAQPSVAYTGTYLPRAPRTFHKGVYLLTVFFGLLVVVAASLPYPVTVNAPMTLQTLHPVVHLQAPKTAQVTKLLVSLGDTVQAGQQLAVLASGTPYDKIQRIREILEYPHVDSVPLENVTGLGPRIQLPFARFIAAQGKWREFKAQDDRTLRELDLLLRRQQVGFDIAQQTARLENVKNTLELQKREIERYRKLHEKGVISAQELEIREGAYLEAEQQMVEAQKELERTISERNRLSNAQRLGVRAMDREERQLVEQLQLSREGLHSAIQSWIAEHVLVSPIDGTISYAAVHAENQWTTKNIRMFSVNPIRHSQWFAECRVPLQRVGELQKDQRVRIHLDAYPYQQWGTLDAITDVRAEVPYEGHYYLRALIAADVTDQGQKLSLAQEMPGTARIQVSRSSLLGRLWGTVGNAMKGDWDRRPKSNANEK